MKIATTHKHIIALAFAAVAVSVNSASAAVLAGGMSIGVDFGPTAQTNNFNTVNTTVSGNLGVGTLITTTNVPVDGVNFAWSANNGWFSNDDAITFVGQPAVFNNNNTTDWMGISNQGGPTGVITLTFSGLNNGFTYNLIIGARFLNNFANTSWTVDGQTLLADATSDTNAFRSFTGLSTDGSGNLVITGTGATARLDIATVSALHLTAIPEPSAALLGAFGMLALLRRRR